MLTCYDFTTARLMLEAGVPILLVGDSAANVILGHDTTLPIPLEFMIELTAAVRRGRSELLSGRGYAVRLVWFEPAALDGERLSHGETFGLRLRED